MPQARTGCGFHKIKRCICNVVKFNAFTFVAPEYGLAATFEQVCYELVFGDFVYTFLVKATYCSTLPGSLRAKSVKKTIGNHFTFSDIYLLRICTFTLLFITKLTYYRSRKLSGVKLSLGCDIS